MSSQVSRYNAVAYTDTRRYSDRMSNLIKLHRLITHREIDDPALSLHQFLASVNYALHQARELRRELERSKSQLPRMRHTWHMPATTCGTLNGSYNAWIAKLDNEIIPALRQARVDCVKRRLLRPFWLERRKRRS